jgi:hypothetical protein
MTETISSNGALVRVGGLAAISAGGLRVIGALIPEDQQSIGFGHALPDHGHRNYPWSDRMVLRPARFGWGLGKRRLRSGHRRCPDYPVEWGDTGRGALPTGGSAGGGRHRRARVLCVASQALTALGAGAPGVLGPGRYSGFARARIGRGFRTRGTHVRQRICGGRRGCLARISRPTNSITSCTSRCCLHV